MQSLHSANERDRELKRGRNEIVSALFIAA
jgi:hypothetical protein